MIATVWIVLALAVVVLLVVVGGVIVATVRERRQRARDREHLPVLDARAERVPELDARAERVPEAEGEDSVRVAFAADVARAIDPISLDAYLADDDTRARVDLLLEMVIAQRPPATEVAAAESRSAFDRRISRLRELRKAYGSIVLRTGRAGDSPDSPDSPGGPDGAPER